MTSYEVNRIPGLSRKKCYYGEAPYILLLRVVKKLTPLWCVNLEICILNYPSEPRLWIRVNVERQGSLPSLALPSVIRRQALAGRILPLLFKTMFSLVFRYRCMQSISGDQKIEYFRSNPYFTDKNRTFYYKTCNFGKNLSGQDIMLLFFRHIK